MRVLVALSLLLTFLAGCSGGGGSSGLLTQSMAPAGFELVAPGSGELWAEFSDATGATSNPGQATDPEFLADLNNPSISWATVFENQDNAIIFSFTATYQNQSSFEASVSESLFMCGSMQLRTIGYTLSVVQFIGVGTEDREYISQQMNSRIGPDLCEEDVDPTPTNPGTDGDLPLGLSGPFSTTSDGEHTFNWGGGDIRVMVQHDEAYDAVMAITDMDDNLIAASDDSEYTSTTEPEVRMDLAAGDYRIYVEGYEEDVDEYYVLIEAN